ncbi:hypothetical protein F5887DRAFT_918557 [Amanita rubescens]|nr:hypothetical protein F5887DRAFT_918557 [Amanita rubescens]
MIRPRRRFAFSVQASTVVSQVPRVVVPTASTDRRARATSAIVRFSASQDDLRVDFEPVRPDNEEAIRRTSEPEPGGRNETWKVTQPKKIGLWKRIRGIMSGGTTKGASRAEKVHKEEMEDPNGRRDDVQSSHPNCDYRIASHRV